MINAWISLDWEGSLLLEEKLKRKYIQTNFKVAFEELRGELSLNTILLKLPVTGNFQKECEGEGPKGHIKPVVTLTPLPNTKWILRATAY